MINVAKKEESELIGPKVIVGFLVLVLSVTAIYYLGFFVYNGLGITVLTTENYILQTVLYFMVGLLSLLAIGLVACVSYIIGDYLIGD